MFNNEKVAEYKELEKKQDIQALQKYMIEIGEDSKILMLEKLLEERKVQKKQHQYVV